MTAAPPAMFAAPRKLSTMALAQMLENCSSAAKKPMNRIWLSRLAQPFGEIGAAQGEQDRRPGELDQSQHPEQPQGELP